METYGVSFEGFEPACGWAMYKHTEEEYLPQLKDEVERWRKHRDVAANERTAIKGLKADLDGMVKGRERLLSRLRSKMPGGERTVNDIVPLDAEEDGVKTSSTWQELAVWLEEAKSPLEQISLFYKHVCERADCGLDMFENAFESTQIDIRFWERILELQRAYWVFEKADLKYKTKFCRELVKALADYIGDCREQLGRYDDDESRETALYEDVNWLFEEAQTDLAYYRQIKSDIAAAGVEVAIKQSSRTKTMPQDGKA